MQKPEVREVILVEGKYDKIAVLSAVNAMVIDLSGFGIFKDEEKRNLIRSLAGERGVIVLTDSDSAGFVIRNHLKGILPADSIKNAYIPAVPGKEKRKPKQSREGLLGVEGMKPEVLLEALKAAGATFDGGNSRENLPPVTISDLYRLGLSGTANSSERRSLLLKKMNLPSYLSTKALLQVLTIPSYYEIFIKEIKETGEETQW